MRLSAVLATLVGGQLVLAFLTQALTMATLGAGMATDCFVAAQTLPTVILSVMATAMLNVWQTQLATVPEKDRTDARASSLGLGLLLAAALLLVVLVLGKALITLLFPGFDEARVYLTTNLMLIVSIGTACNVGVVASVAAGRVAGRFILIEAIPLGLTLLALAALPLVLARYGVYGAAWLLALRSLLIFVTTSGMLGMTRAVFRIDGYKRYALAQMRPVLLGSSFYKLGPVVDRFWASKTTAGGLTLYNFAGMGAAAASSVLERALGTPVVPEIARTWRGAGPDHVMRLVRAAMIKVWVATGLCALALIPVSWVWAPLCAYFLHLDANQATMLLGLIIAVLPQLGTTASGTLLVSVFYAAGDTRASVRIITGIFVAGVLAKSAAFSLYGLLGMAVANSLQLVATSVALYIGASRLIQRTVSIDVS